MPRLRGLLGTGLFILAWMIVWGFLIKTASATRTEDDGAATALRGLVYDMG